MNTLKHLIYWLKTKPSGLKRQKSDERDLDVKMLGWGEYKPLHQRHINETLSTKNQYPLNTCSWCAHTVAKEPDEGVELSVRSLVIKGLAMGLISRDGFADIRSGMKVLQKWGIMEAKDLPEGVMKWSEYIKGKIDDAKAGVHKIESYWSVTSRSDILRLCDEGKILTTGLDWHDGFNQGGGFSFPWIIYKIVGWFVGGHAVDICGYDLNYHDRQVYIFKNSYGEKWGDESKFYVDMEYFDRNNKYGCWVSLDIPLEQVKKNYMSDLKISHQLSQRLPKYSVIFLPNRNGELYLCDVSQGTKSWKWKVPNPQAYIHVATPVSNAMADAIRTIETLEEVNYLYK